MFLPLDIVELSDSDDTSDEDAPSGLGGHLILQIAAELHAERRKIDAKSREIDEKLRQLEDREAVCRHWEQQLAEREAQLDASGTRASQAARAEMRAQERSPAIEEKIQEAVTALNNAVRSEVVACAHEETLQALNRAHDLLNKVKQLSPQSKVYYR